MDKYRKHSSRIRGQIVVLVGDKVLKISMRLTVAAFVKISSKSRAASGTFFILTQMLKTEIRMHFSCWGVPTICTA